MRVFIYNTGYVLELFPMCEEDSDYLA